jgi:hypothetical protein
MNTIETQTKTYGKVLGSMTVGRLIDALGQYPADTVIDLDLLNMNGEIIGTAAYLAVEYEASRVDVPGDPAEHGYPRVVLVVAHPDV